MCHSITQNSSNHLDWQNMRGLIEYCRSKGWRMFHPLNSMPNSKFSWVTPMTLWTASSDTSLAEPYQLTSRRLCTMRTMSTKPLKKLLHSLTQCTNWNSNNRWLKFFHPAPFKKGTKESQTLDQSQTEENCATTTN